MILDTCALLWLALDQKHLSSHARAAIASAPLAVSAISAFEIATLCRKKRLRLPRSAEEWYEGSLAHHGISEIPIDGRIAASSALLPPHHADPCDRIIVATAMVHSLTILTPDPLIRKYRVKILW